MSIDYMNPFTRGELVYAKRDDAVSRAHARGDKSLVLREGGNLDRPHHKLIGLVDDIDRGPLPRLMIAASGTFATETSVARVSVTVAVMPSATELSAFSIVKRAA